MKRMQSILLIISALISRNAIPAVGHSLDRRRISPNRRQLQLVLDNPLEPENEELSYSNNEEANNNDNLDTETPSKESEGELSYAADEDASGKVIFDSEEEDSPQPVQAPVKAKRHSPTSAPTMPAESETPPTPSPEKSPVANTPAPTPMRKSAVKTSPPTPAPTKLSIIDMDPPTVSPTKLFVAETPRPSPAPTQTIVVETPSPTETPTKSPVKKTHHFSQTEQPTLFRENSEPDDYDLWDNELDGAFPDHATLSPSASPKESTESKNHALEKEAEEFVEDPYVRVATLVFAVVCVTLLIIVAQQMVENPDGFCAKLCRWTVAFFRVLTYPCLCCCGSRNKAHHTHTLVATDGFDDYDHDLSLA